MSDYGGLTRDELERRLRLAEDFCVMSGWCATRQDSDRQKAALELWMRWHHHVGPAYTNPVFHRELAGSESSLARQRDETVRATLARLQQQPPGASLDV